MLNEGDALYLGGEAIDEVYLGTEKVWPSFAVSDDFNRPDDPSGLGPNWIQRHGALAIVNNMVRPIGATSWGQYTHTTVMPGDSMEASVTLGPAHPTIDHFMIFVGTSATGECVFAYFYQNSAYWWHQSSWAQYSMIQGPIGLGQAPGDTFTFRRVGYLHTILKNSVDTGINITYSSIPIDANHRQVGFGLYTEDGANYRTIDSFNAKPL